MINRELAFPTVPKNHGYEDAHGTGSGPGMTLRDYFAAQAIAGYCANPEFTQMSDKDMAMFAYDVADAALKKREE